MSLLTEWREAAYEREQSREAYEKFWNRYFQLEKGVYEEILPLDTPVKGTVSELSKHFGVDIQIMTGILDGINDSLKTANPIETMDENTEVNLDFDKEKLYYNMVGARADWLYNLPAWDNLLTEERRKELYKEQKQSTTIVKGPKIGRNSPCPCGSGKKYKYCCMRKQ